MSQCRYLELEESSLLFMAGKRAYTSSPVLTEVLAPLLTHLCGPGDPSGGTELGSAQDVCNPSAWQGSKKGWILSSESSCFYIRWLCNVLPLSTTASSPFPPACTPQPGQPAPYPYPSRAAPCHERGAAPLAPPSHFQGSRESGERRSPAARGLKLTGQGLAPPLVTFAGFII